MKLSIIITAYNCEAYLAQALDSAIQAAPADAEIVVVDDGSLDQSVQVFERKILGFHGAFRLVRHPAGANRGPGAARNAGIEAASGDWLAFLDGDDYYLPNRFATDLLMLGADTALDGVAGVTRIDIESSDAGTLQEDVGRLALPAGVTDEQILASLLAEKFWHANALTVRRSLVDAVGGFPEHLRMSEDCTLWLRLALTGRIRASHDPAPIAVYRRRTGSTLQVGLESMACLLQAMTEVWGWAKTRKVSAEMRRILAQGARRYFIKTAGAAHLSHRRLEANVLCKRFLQVGGWRLLGDTKAGWLVLRIVFVRLCSFREWQSGLKRLWQALVLAVWDRPLAPADALEQQAVIELQKAFAALPEMDCTGCQPSEAAWHGNMNRLRSLVLQEDPRAFIRWPVIYQSMFITAVPYVRTELRYLQARPNWTTRWRPAVQECPVGRPFPCWFYPRSSGNLLHHAYHLALFEAQTGIAVHEMDFVVEFGGGYGSMCRLLHNLGFRGQYLIYDLVHFSHLQRYFLKASRYPVVGEHDEIPMMNGIACLSSMEQFESALRGVPSGARKMFLATWSISEVPVPLRDHILGQIKSFEAYLIGYQDVFGEVDNMTYFRDWRKGITNVRWEEHKIEHLPADWFLFGKQEVGGR